MCVHDGPWQLPGTTANHHLHDQQENFLPLCVTPPNGELNSIRGWHCVVDPGIPGSWAEVCCWNPWYDHSVSCVLPLLRDQPFCLYLVAQCTGEGREGLQLERIHLSNHSWRMGATSHVLSPLTPLPSFFSAFLFLFLLLLSTLRIPVARLELASLNGLAGCICIWQYPLLTVSCASAVVVAFP